MHITMCSMISQVDFIIGFHLATTQVLKWKKYIDTEQIQNEGIYDRSEEFNLGESVLDISQNTTIEDQRDEISRAFKRSAN